MLLEYISFSVDNTNKQDNQYHQAGFHILLAAAKSSFDLTYCPCIAIFRREIPKAAMPTEPRSTHKKESSSGRGTSYGQVIEYIRGEAPKLQFLRQLQSVCGEITLLTISFFLDRLYLASYTHAPTASTPFPYPLSHDQTSSGASETQVAGKSGRPDQPHPIYFSVDKYLRYNSFYADFGPLHIGHAYRFSISLHEVLAASEKESRPIVFWSKADSKSKLAE